MTMPDMTGVATPAEARRHKHLEAVVRWALVVTVLGCLAVAVGESWSDVRTSLSSVSAPVLVASGLLMGIALLGPWRAWHAVVADDRTLAWRTSSEIFYVGQLGKYVPGAIWPVVMQMRLGRRAGLTRTEIGTSFVITLAQGVTTGILLGLLAMPWLLERSPQWAWGLLLVPVAATALSPRVLAAFVRLLLRLTRRADTTFVLSGRAGRRGVAAYCFFWVFGALHLYLLVVSLGGDPLTSLPLSAGALALAMGLGPLFVVLPAGAGVRETILVGTLTSVLSFPDAVAAALLSRALVVAGDIVLGLLAFVAAKREQSAVRTAGAGRS
jgi:uncharacterized membrane protein YbhN (UPF0104 family)